MAKKREAPAAGLKMEPVAQDVIPTWLAELLRIEVRELVSSKLAPERVP